MNKEQTKYKIIAEYDRYYLAVHPNGWKECFNKKEFKPTKDGYIIKCKEKDFNQIESGLTY